MMTVNNLDASRTDARNARRPESHFSRMNSITTDTRIARIDHVEPAEAGGRTKELLDGVNASLGVVPNMVKTMAGSALLEGYLGLAGALSRGRIRPAVAERIAVAVADSNDCSYCLSVHSYLAEHAVKIDSADISAARAFQSADPKAAAALAFAQAVLLTRGEVDDATLEAARRAGLDDAELAEIVGHVAVNVLTNYFNKTFAVELDFPAVDPRVDPHR
jgi:AhpD family alkylhydroperoxidase